MEQLSRQFAGERKDREPNFRQVIIFMGPEGSGKSTQTRYLALESGLPCFSTGDLLRAAAVNPNSLYHDEAKLVFAENKYASAEAAFGVTQEFFHDNKHLLANGVIIDGYFRIPEQVDELEELMQLAELNLPVNTFYLSASDDICLSRLEERARAGETREGNIKRLGLSRERLEERIAAIARKYGDVVIINGEQPVYSTQGEIMSNI